jgi:hypothetical protein
MEQAELNVRFEVSTAVTMMIIISQKMIIIKQNLSYSSTLMIEVLYPVRQNST